MPKISIIIPVYNVEKYLRRCLDSVRSQTFSDFEVLCINDGSTDNSKKILDEYADCDSRFIVINKKNSGVSAARNDGIKHANGEYIHFMDADDFIDSRYYAEMVKMAESFGLDMVCSGFVTNTKYARDIIYKSKSVVNTIYKKLRNTYVLTDGYVWRYLFKTNFIKQNGLRFDIKLISQEDAIFVLNAISYADSIGFVPGVYYHYMFNDMSALNNRDKMHHKKIKEQYRQAKQYKRDFVRKYHVQILWFLRKFFRRF